MGKEFKGKMFLSRKDREEGVAVVTEWFCLRGIAIVPLGSYRVALGKGCKRFFTDYENCKVLSKVPLNLGQILTTWILEISWFALILGLTIVMMKYHFWH